VPEPVARANGHAQTRRSRSGGAARSIQPPGDGKAGPSGAARLPSDSVHRARHRRRLLDDRLTAETERIRNYVADDLRPGLSVEQAGQRYYALAGAELYYLLTAELAWTADAHRKWLTELLTTELLAPRHRSDGL
jgi:hypothetical protein